MKLDTGMDRHNLISPRLVEEMGLASDVENQEEDICECLDGKPLRSTGTITVRWKGKSFLKIFTTIFHLVEEYDPAWEMLLSAETIFKHKIFEYKGFGGRAYFSTKQKGKYGNLAFRSVGLADEKLRQ
jgi:hypothetical protein